MSKEYITLVSAILVVIGWFVNSYLNRKHEIFKKRLDYRLKMLESYKDVGEALERLFNNGDQNLADDFVSKLEKAQINFLLYGTKKEIELINKITEHASKNEYIEMKNKSAALMKLVRNNLRSELGLKSI